MEILAFSDPSLNGTARGTDTMSPAAAGNTRRFTALGERTVAVSLPVGVFEAVERLARLRAVELNREVAAEDVLADAIRTYLLDAGFLQSDGVTIDHGQGGRRM